MSDLERMKELVEQLDAAARAYYQESKELMSNKEYDELYDELAALEKKTGTVLAKSPTAHAGYEVLSALPKENHPSPMLSLDKTKEVSQLQEFLKDQTGILSWKLDGLTIVLTYENGTLTKAVTRGNGITGEVVTQNARQFENLPAKISFKGRLVLRGEAVISYKDFERINEENPDADAKYKNPRNLCAGSVRQLNSQVTAGRHVQFIAFALVSAEDMTFNNSRRCYNLGELILAGITARDAGVDILDSEPDALISLLSNGALTDLTNDMDQIHVGSLYKEAVTWQDHCYGMTFDNVGDTYFMVYSRDYLEEIGMDVTPTEKFMAGEWSYDDMKEYLTEMKAKLPEGVYPIGIHYYHWASMAAAANGVIQIDSWKYQLQPGRIY